MMMPPIAPIASSTSLFPILLFVLAALLSFTAAFVAHGEFHLSW